MGNAKSAPKNKTGKDVVAQKVENAKKLGVLSLQGHKLRHIPDVVYTIPNLRTLDLSKNKLTALGNNISTLPVLKSLNFDENQLTALALKNISELPKLQTLSACGNMLGMPITENNSRSKSIPLPSLPPSLKQLKLSFNSFESFPLSICSSNLYKLEKLDLSNNSIASIPEAISSLSSLTELNLDQNAISSLTETIGKLKKLKSLSLRRNQVRVDSVVFSDQNPQPIPASLFTQTQVIDLNLDGNLITSTQLNDFDGFQSFLDRRKDVKTKNLYGGAMTDLGLCGLE